MEGDGTEVVPGGEVDGGVERGGEAAEQGNGRLGAAFLDALDAILGHRGPRSEFRHGQAELDTDVIQCLAEGEGLAARDPLGVVGGLFGARPAGVVAGVTGAGCARRRSR